MEKKVFNYILYNIYLKFIYGILLYIISLRKWSWYNRQAVLKQSRDEEGNLRENEFTFLRYMSDNNERLIYVYIYNEYTIKYI